MNLAKIWIRYVTYLLHYNHATQTASFSLVNRRVLFKWCPKKLHHHVPVTTVTVWHFYCWNDHLWMKLFWIFFESKAKCCWRVQVNLRFFNILIFSWIGDFWRDGISKIRSTGTCPWVAKHLVKIAKKENDYQSFGKLWCFGFFSVSLTFSLHPKNLNILRNILFLYHFIISIICVRNLIQTLRRYLFRTVPVNGFWNFAFIWGVLWTEIGINGQKTHIAGLPPVFALRFLVYGSYLVHWNYGKYQRSTISEGIPVIYTVFIRTLLFHHISSAFYPTTLHRLHINLSQDIWVNAYTALNCQ